MKIMYKEKKTYQLYKIYWKMERNINYLSECIVYGNYLRYIKEEHIEPCDYTLEDYILDVGYHGEIYASFDEFLDNEYQDEKFIKQLQRKSFKIEKYARENSCVQNQFNGNDLKLFSRKVKGYKTRVLFNNEYGTSTFYEVVSGFINGTNRLCGFRTKLAAYTVDLPSYGKLYVLLETTLKGHKEFVSSKLFNSEAELLEAYSKYKSLLLCGYIEGCGPVSVPKSNN